MNSLSWYLFEKNYICTAYETGSVGRAVRQRSAKPSTAVRTRHRPLSFDILPLIWLEYSKNWIVVLTVIETRPSEYFFENYQWDFKWMFNFNSFFQPWFCREKFQKKSGLCLTMTGLFCIFRIMLNLWKTMSGFISGIRTNSNMPIRKTSWKKTMDFHCI